MDLQVLKKPKAAEILEELRTGDKCVRELQEARGGSFSTLAKRIGELLDAGLLRVELEKTRAGDLRKRKTANNRCGS